MIATIFALWFIPKALISGKDLTRPEELKSENDLRTVIVQFGAGIVVGSGIYFTGRQLQLTRARNEAEHFVEALKQLESPQSAVALGGIHALENLGRTSSSFSVAVFEVLSAFIRSNAAPADEAAPRRPPSPEVEGALFAVGQWPSTGRHRRLRLDAIDLSNRDLGRIRLPGANLWKATLINVNLQGAELEGANFQNADLRRANLRNANLRNAVLNGASLDGANIDGADLRGAQLAGVELNTAKGRPITD
ncbi:MAG: pentapeptide repeat-containing protein [Actinobacteria bacterium]|nr:pentapeptide repeat-containing protein [Actinomycetota bacterium]